MASSPEPVTESEILRTVNVGQMRLRNMLKILEVEARSSAPGASGADLRAVAHDEERQRRVTEVRRAEQAAMEQYGRTGKCLMEFLLQQLDDPGAEPCGRWWHGFIARGRAGRGRGAAARAPPVGGAARRAPTAVAERDDGAEGSDRRGATAPARAGAERAERWRLGRSRSEGRGRGEFADALVTAAAELVGSAGGRTAADVGDVRAVVRREPRARVRGAAGLRSACPSARSS